MAKANSAGRGDKENHNIQKTRKWNRFKAAMPSFIALLVIIILFCLITWHQITSYFTPVFYEENFGISNAGDTLDKNSPPNNFAYFKIRVSTRSAFIPFEKVKLSVLFAEVDTALIRKTWNSVKIFQVHEGHLTDAKINKESLDHKADATNLSGKAKLMAQYAAGDASFFLHSTDNPNEYYGECELTFYKEGKYPMTLSIPDVSALYDLANYKIEIGSMVDTMNKKTNDLLFILTVLNLILWVYSEIKNGLKDVSLKK
jgi:hypothetical protein